MSHEIVDIRRIRFPQEVLPTAIALAPAVLGLRVAPAEIADVAVETRDPPVLAVVFRAHGAAGLERRSVPGPALAAALIAYCRRIGVPVSRAATKSVGIDGGAVVLATDYRRRVDVGAIMARGEA